MKVTGFLSELLIEDLVRISGIPAQHPDRLTRQEVARYAEWAKAQPQVAAALRDKSNPHHASVQLYRGLLEHYETAHPQDPSGVPAPWPDRPGRPAAIEGKPFSELFPDEAAALHAWAETSDEYQAIYRDASHPQHAGITARTLAMLEVASHADGDAAAPATEGRAPDAAQQQQIDELRKNPAYLDKAHPGHQAAVDAVTKVYEAPQQPAAGAPARTVLPTGSGSKTAQERIAALKDNKAYWDKSSPGHAAATQEASQAFAEAYPEPAA